MHSLNELMCVKKTAFFFCIGHLSHMSGSRHFNLHGHLSFCRIALVELYDGVIMKWILRLDFMGRFHRNRRGREFPFFVDWLLLKIAINCLSSEYSGYQHEVSVRLSSCINSVPSFWILSTSEFDYCNIRQRIVII